MSSQNNDKDEIFWYVDIRELISKKNILKIIPQKNFLLNENLNASVRLTVIISIFVSCITRNWNYLYLIVAGFLITLVLYKKYKYPIIENYITKGDPTIENPVKNILQKDYSNINDHTNINNLLDNKEMINKIKKSLDHNLYRDEGDIFDNMHSQRSFYTVPVDTIPNKQMELAEWLYKMPKTCKEGNKNRCSGILYNPPQTIGKGNNSLKVIIR